MIMKHKKLFKISLITVSAIALIALSVFLYFFFSLRSIKDTGIPRLDITTENRFAEINKRGYTPCTISLSDTEAEYTFTDLPGGIKGRGNSTWKLYPKKPYRIQFETKTSIFGEQENRSWVLLAMYNDFSYIKDMIAFSFADSMNGDDFVPCYHYVELYINGSYKGLYLLTDQIDENKGRTDVEYTFTQNDTEVPFIVEMDDYAPEEGVLGIDYFDIGERHFNVKYPDDTDRYTQAQFDYIENYVKTVDKLCRKKNVTLAELSEYIDVDSFIDYYIVQELMGQSEIDFKSVYMSKAVDGKLKMGPVWDYDWAVNGPYLTKYKNINIDRTEGLYSGNNWFACLYKNSPEFKEALSKRYSEVREGFYEVLKTVSEEKDILSKAVKKDKIRWHLFHFKADFVERSDEVIDWLEKRLSWMDKAFIVSE